VIITVGDKQTWSTAEIQRWKDRGTYWKTFSKNLQKKRHPQAIMDKKLRALWSRCWEYRTEPEMHHCLSVQAAAAASAANVAAERAKKSEEEAKKRESC
jgi:hypothetical protein